MTLPMQLIETSHWLYTIYYILSVCSCVSFIMTLSYYPLTIFPLLMCISCVT